VVGFASGTDVKSFSSDFVNDKYEISEHMKLLHSNFWVDLGEYKLRLFFKREKHEKRERDLLNYDMGF